MDALCSEMGVSASNEGDGSCQVGVAVDIIFEMWETWKQVKTSTSTSFCGLNPRYCGERVYPPDLCSLCH